MEADEEDICKAIGCTTLLPAPPATGEPALLLSTLEGLQPEFRTSNRNRLMITHAWLCLINSSKIRLYKSYWAAGAVVAVAFIAPEDT
jgi:hypothetical protein